MAVRHILQLRESCHIAKYTICFSVIIAEVRALTAVQRATLRWRIISTAPSAVFGMAVDWPARTDRAAVSASTVSDFPAIRRVRRSPRFTSSTWCPGSPDRASESRPVAAGALDAERGDTSVTLGPGDQLLVAV